MLKKITLCLLCSMTIFSAANAQKFGHLNYGNIIEQMPDMKGASTEMEAYQQQLSKKGEEMLTALQTKYMAFQKEAEGGGLSQMQLQQKEAELQKDQEAIEAYRGEAQGKIEDKRAELLTPIMNKVLAAVKQVGKEGSYTFIFDASLPNTILYAQETEDVMPLVKKALGLP